MSISLSFAKSPRPKADTAVIFADDKGRLLPSGAALDKKAGGLIGAALAARGTFKGRHGDLLAVFLPKGAGYKQALVVGLGKLAALDRLALEYAGGKTLAALKNISAQNVSVLYDHDKTVKAKEDEAAALYASGLYLRAYLFDKYKKPKNDGNKKDKSGDGVKSLSLKSVTIVTQPHAAANRLYAEHRAVADGVRFARDLVNEVPNVLYPESYAAILAKELRPLGVQVEILDEKKMAKLGFGAHLAVGMGSIRPPRVVIMRWNGIAAKAGAKGAKGGKKSTAGAATGPLAFVGKGVTFDTGGISIKPAAGMEEMKMDMGGSAAVAGLIRALAVRKAPVDVVGIVGLAENMPSDRSYRPGDIVTSLSGKTIEILNTDAEGRLVLADAMTYVQRTYKPRMMVDLATLTGAIMVALGYDYAGTFVNDDALWAQIEKASAATGDKVWRMPLDESFRNEMKGSVSDLQNLGSAGRWGGACSAAGFLEMFVENDIPWAHIDIAGTAWSKADKPVTPRGGTGYGVRLLYNLVTANYA
ncbi:MAG: leucyl aminopeptidase [Micavibrio sp.]